jgi:hypothetical protein
MPWTASTVEPALSCASSSAGAQPDRMLRLVTELWSILIRPRKSNGREVFVELPQPQLRGRSVGSHQHPENMSTPRGQSEKGARMAPNRNDEIHRQLYPYDSARRRSRLRSDTHKSHTHVQHVAPCIHVDREHSHGTRSKHHGRDRSEGPDRPRSRRDRPAACAARWIPVVSGRVLVEPFGAVVRVIGGDGGNAFGFPL